jgi:dCTP deaminase
MAGWESSNDPKAQCSVLTREQIIDLIEKGDLIVTPLLTGFKQVQGVSIDVRLNTEFIVIHRSRYSLVDPVKDREDVGRRSQERVWVPFKHALALHPNELILGSTLEYVVLPDFLTAYVIGRSSWGRLGLVIATATVVHPAFKGCITLELINLGNVPLMLYPGLRIAQLVVHRAEGHVSPPVTYDCPTGPEFSAIWKDPDIKVLRRLRERMREVPLGGHSGSVR